MGRKTTQAQATIRAARIGFFGLIMGAAIGAMRGNNNCKNNVTIKDSEGVGNIEVGDDYNNYMSPTEKEEKDKVREQRLRDKLNGFHSRRNENSNDAIREARNSLDPGKISAIYSQENMLNFRDQLNRIIFRDKEELKSLREGQDSIKGQYYFRISYVINNEKYQERWLGEVTYYKNKKYEHITDLSCMKKDSKNPGLLCDDFSLHQY